MSARPDRRPRPRQDRSPRGGGRNRWERDSERRPFRGRSSEGRSPQDRGREPRPYRDGGPGPGADRSGGRGRPYRSPRPARTSAPGGSERRQRFADERSAPSRGDRRGRPDERWQPAAAEGGSSGEGESHAAAAPSDLIWGRHSVQATLESERPIHRIWCTPEMRFSPRFLQLLREAKASGVLVEEVTWARLGQITGGAVHQGIALQPAAAETLDLASLIDGCRSLGEPPLLMAVDGLTDPRNLGAIVRSAEALGAHGMVLPQRRNAGLTGAVAKVAAGALEHLPVARVVNLNRSLETLRQEGYRIIGLAAEGTLTPAEADLEGPLVIVAGSESDGLSLLTRRNCDQLVRIPLRGATPSLNAAVATALILYEVARCGWMRGVRGTAPAPRLLRPAMPTAAPPEAEEVAAEEAPAASPPLDDVPQATGEVPQAAPDFPAEEAAPEPAPPAPTPAAAAPAAAPEEQQLVFEQDIHF